MSEPISAKPKPRKEGFFTARYFAVRGLVLIALFLFAHLAGWREHTTFLTGTPASPDVSLERSGFYGIIYILTYLGCVVVAPILLLAAGLLAMWRRFEKPPGRARHSVRASSAAPAKRI